MDTAAQWPQGIGLGNYKKLAEAEAAGTAKPILENINSDNRSSSSSRSQQIKNHQPLNCPRCTSTNTKFCYYNNYSLSQPRYFCKTCRRYWTEGGSLRNVPVGGGSRKTKRFSSSSPSVSSKNNNINPPLPDHHHQINPRIHFDQTIPHDLNLTYPQPIITHHHHDCNHRPYDDDHHQHHQVQNPNTSSTTTAAANDRIFPPASRGFFSSLFMPAVTGLDIVSDPNTIYTSGFNIPLQEFKPSTLNFSLDGDGSSAFESSGVENERILFPGAEDVNNNKSSSTAPTATTATNSNNNNNNSNSNNNIY